MQQECYAGFDNSGNATDCAGNVVYTEPVYDEVDVIYTPPASQLPTEMAPANTTVTDTIPAETTTEPNALQKLMAWTKEHPVTAAAIGGGLWFLFFAGNKKKRRKR